MPGSDSGSRWTTGRQQVPPPSALRPPPGVRTDGSPFRSGTLTPPDSCLFSRPPRVFPPSRTMSVAVAEGCFLSALQPNSSCTAYVVPSDGPSPDPVAKARRVREQVRMRLAEKKSSSLPGLDDSLLASTGGSGACLRMDISLTGASSVGQ